MSFVDAIKSAFSKYATFSGRARRSEYWYFVLLNVIVSVVISILGMIIGDFASVISGIWSLAILVPSLALVWRRLHDIGKGGVWILIGLIPLVGGIILLVFMCKDSQPGANQFGPSPKE